MKSTFIAVLTFALLSLTTASAAEKVSAAAKAATPEHPGDVALTKSADGKLNYKSFPGDALLYVFVGDPSGKMKCNAGCESAWPPLLVREHAPGTKIGKWIVISRDDGLKQWTYKGAPVYTAFHGMAQGAKDASVSGFHLLEP